jgi:UDP-glucose 4-epimerase
MPSVRITDLASVLIGSSNVLTAVTGIRPGEKIHEALISEEESWRTVRRGQYYAIMPTLPELQVPDSGEPFNEHEFSSADGLLDKDGVAAIIRTHHLEIEDNPVFQ